MRRLALLLCGLALVAGSTSALASDFNFSFGTTGDPFSGSGVFTASSIAGGEYLITGISGTTDTGNGVDRKIAGLLAPGTFPTLNNGGTSPANDNLLFFPQSGGGYFDYLGVSWALQNGAELNLYSNPLLSDNAFLLRVNGNTVDENVAVTVTEVAPEPTTLALLGTGILATVGSIKRRLYR